MENFDKRLVYIFEKFSLTASSFADKIGVQRSSMSHILSGRNKPSLDFILKIYETFPEISLPWLTLGDGEFYKNNNLASIPNSIFVDEENHKIIRNNDSIKEIDFPEEQIIDSDSLIKTESLTKINTSEPPEAINDNTPFPIVDSQSEIEQILFFYKDGTFKSYRPK